MIQWPQSSLGSPELDTYSLVRDPRRLSSDPATGLFTSNVLDTTQPLVATVSWLWTREQMEIFRLFFDSTLIYGSKFFTMNIWKDDGFYNYRCRFMEPYSAEIVGQGWRVSATLLVNTTSSTLVTIVTEDRILSDGAEVRVTSEGDIRGVV